MKNRKFTLLLIGGFLTGAFLLTIILYANSRSFSTKKWLESPRKRDQIIDSFLDTHDVVGMKKSEIINLLGKDESVAPFKVGDTMVYYIGMDGFLGFFAIDSIWLVLTLSDNDVVTKIEIQQD
jgi:hypothetical protein